MIGLILKQVSWSPASFPVWWREGSQLATAFEDAGPRNLPLRHLAEDVQVYDTVRILQEHVFSVFETLYILILVT